jgi:hypothetical protein
MNKDFFKSFLAWLDSASDQELDQRQRQIQELLEDRIRSRDTRRDAEFMIRKIEEERLARLR